ncbi:MAG: prephenate dehydrogenase/arogenate dehydrogenase family protein [Pseudomonadota bacterium]
MTEKQTDIRSEALDQLRKRLDAVDARLVETIGERQDLVRQIGQLKAAEGHQTRDFRREKVVLDKARATAESVGVSPELATDVLAAVIRASLQDQEQARIRGSASGSGKSALVLGGAGRMGRWFVEYFHSQGYAVAIVDPAADLSKSHVHESLAAAGVDYDVIVVAATLAVSAALLAELEQLSPRGLVFDVGSLKTPLVEPLRSLANSGVSVTSLHPMFGPSTRLLAGRHMIFCDVGNPEATAAARAIFADTMVESVDMTLEAHDELIAFVLGLSHFVNIAFVDTLANSGIDAEALALISSPTFDAQFAMGSTVVHENPDLYFEIQRLNQFRDLPLRGLRESVTRLQGAVSEDDLQQFRQSMLAARAYVDGYKGAR